jgi:hypothetical protein
VGGEVGGCGGLMGRRRVRKGRGDGGMEMGVLSPYRSTVSGSAVHFYLILGEGGI